MEQINIDLLEIVEIIRRDALPADWEAQYQRGERIKRFSQYAFSQGMKRAFPEIVNETWLKKVYNYHQDHEAGKVRGLDVEEVNAFFGYLDFIGTGDGWPEVTKVFKSKQSKLIEYWLKKVADDIK